MIEPTEHGNPKPALEHPLLQFDDFLVDPVGRVLLRGGEPVALTPKVFSVLLVLLEKRGAVVSKDELIQRVWAGSFVTEANLTQSVSTLRKTLGERANDHRYIVTVPGQGYCFAGAVTTAGEPAAETSAPAAVPGPPVRVRGRRRLELLAIVLFVSALAAWLYLARAAREPSLVPEGLDGAVPGHRLSIALLGFRNLSARPESQWLAAALPEMLATELAAAKRVRVIPAENVARARLETEPLDDDALERIRDTLGPDLIAVGSYLTLGDGQTSKLRLDVRVLQVADGETLASLVETGTEPELFDLVSRTGGRLREALGLAGLSSQQARAARALLPGSPAAARLYAEGLAKLRAYDPPGALALLEEAAQADPGSAVVRSALSQAWGALGHDARAADEARRAVDLARALPREERLAIEARLHEVSHEWDKAIEIYRSLWTFYPDNLEYGLRLAAGLTEAGYGPAAAAAVAAVRRLPPPDGEDPRIDLVEADVAKRLADSVTQERAARSAEAKGRASGDRLVVAQALLLQGVAQDRQSNAPEAVRLFQEAAGLFERAGHQAEMARALSYVGVALYGQGDLDGAEARFRRALDVVQRLGSQEGVALEAAHLGLLYRDRGDLRQAQDSLTRSRSLHARIGDRVLEVRALHTLGTVLWARGDLAEARGIFLESLESSRATGNRRDEASALDQLGRVLASEGRLEDALHHHEQALALLRGIGDSGFAATALAGSADVLIRLGRLPAARSRLEQALAAKRQAHEEIGAGEVLDSLAGLARETGDLALAGRLAGEQLRSARARRAGLLVTKGLRRQGQVSFDAGDLSAARRSLEEALRASLARGTGPETAGLRLDLAALALSEGLFGAADRLAREAAGWYGSKGLPGGQGEAWSLIAEALARQGNIDEARDAAARARLQAGRTEDRSLPLRLAPRLARADVASGEAQRVLADLSQAAAEAARLGFVITALEARLALGELQQDLGKAEAKSTLAAVRRDAEARGLHGLARRAAGFLQRPAGGLAGSIASSRSSGRAASP